MTRPADTTAYASGDLITSSTSSPTVFEVQGCSRGNFNSGVILAATLIDSANQTTKGDFDLFIFDATYTPDNDNAAFTPTDAELETCLGVIRFSSGNFVVGDATSGAGGNSVCSGTLVGNIPFKTGASSSSLFLALVARSAYTPVASEKFTVRLQVLQD
jgi:hypothetical protein